MVSLNPMKLMRSKQKHHNNIEDNYDVEVVPENPSRRKSMASINFIPKKSWGWKIRDAVGAVESTLGPYLKKIFPSFIAVHYFYIISCAIIGSILIYPVKTVKYIDALFLASGAATQAGLNTVDVNKLSLYQQIVIYIMCCLSTPIFIHGSLCFLRLYWFERYFDDIRETSKLHFKMRRTATMMARTQSMENSRTMESGVQTLGNNRARNLSKASAKNNSQSNNITEQSSRTFVNPTMHDGESPETKDSDTSSSELAPVSPIPLTQSAVDIRKHDHTNPQQQTNEVEHHFENNSVEHLSEPSSDEEVQQQLPPDLRHPHDPTINDVEDISESKTTPNIKFGDLPKPRKHEVEPRDVFMSISMLRNSQQKDTKDEENEGPALVIHGPAEREKPIRQNSAIQFDIQDKPSRHRRRNHKRTPRPSLSSFRLGSHHRAGNTVANDSINEQHDIDSILDDNTSLNTNDDSHNLKKVQSNLQLPSSDQTGGKKFGKRSNTLDVANHKSSLLHKSPTFERMIRQKLKPKKIRRRFSSTAIEDSSLNYSDSDTESDDDYDQNSLSRHMSTNYLSWNPQIGRNSTFVNLSDQQKEELGGVEYRAIKLLSKILLFYYIGFHILSFLFLVPWIHTTKTYQEPVTSSGVTLSWWGFFTAMSAFNDLGFTLTPDSMNSFNTSIFALLILSFFIVIGNTGFPILLRFIIWVLFKFSRDLSLFKESLGFLLDHPRRCFTLLFPSAPTWWLLFILVVLNAIDLILFVILDLGASVVKSLPVNIRVLDGFFQAISTRTAGFTCIDLSKLHPGVQVSYLVMMYISVLPLAISIRRTNVYEEQSLGVYAGHHEQQQQQEGQGNTDDADNQNATSFIGAHLRKQLSFDLWFVFMGLFIICIAEGDRIKDPNYPEFSIFQVLFEVVSAYGTVGLSLGYPNSTPSFSGQFNVVSKLVIIAMMIRGRHRGLPYSLDRAIILPSEKMEIRDRYQDLHAGNHLQRAETMGSVGDPVLTFFKNAAPHILRDRIKRPSFLGGRSQSVRSTRDNSYVSGYQGNTFDNQQPAGQSSNSAYHDHNNSNNAPGFKDVHFNHQAPSNVDVTDDLAPHQVESHELNDLDYAHVGSNSHVESDGDDEQSQYEDSENDDDVYRAETFGGNELPDLGSRRNSNVTL